ncbi:MAG: hypothetical protein JSU77_06895 [Fidelibacterota bacterium]|nr:MAG: hypothetical protein JSU77_06895 [Candidatus Neomarinimicrobiota bacterium]
MTHRERVLAACSHQEPDRVPVDIGATKVTSIHRVAYQNLRQHLGLEPREETVWDRMQQIVLPDEDLLQYFDVDTRPLFAGPPDHFKSVELDGDRYRDQWDVVRKRPENGFYYDIVESPLAGEPTLDDLDRFSWPDPDDPGIVRGLDQRAATLHEETDYAVVLNLSATILHTSQYLRGFEGWFIDIALRPDFMAALMDRILELHLRTINNLFREVDGAHVDVVFLSDDLAIDQGPMISPASYRELLKPRHRKLIETVKNHTDAKILYHSCGAVHHFIDDLIEIGVDAINPVQVTSQGMETSYLKESFGDRIAFWGGIDTRYILPQGSVDEVKIEVKRVIGDLAPDGGYVLNFVHNAQPDVKPENICAMIETAREVGTYPLCV